MTETEIVPAGPQGGLLAGLQAVKAVLAPDLTDAELMLFAMVAARSGLDPFAKQIYAVKRKGKVTFQTGIDGLRSIAARTGLYDGQDAPVFSPAHECGALPTGHPEFATVNVYRKGVNRPFPATAYWHEYIPEGEAFMWRRMPHVMLAKVAEALALRKAFPWDAATSSGIGGDIYTAEEMAQADRAAPPVPDLSDRMEGRAVMAQIMSFPPDQVAAHARGLFPDKAKLSDLTTDEKRLLLSTLHLDAEIVPEAEGSTETPVAVEVGPSASFITDEAPRAESEACGATSPWTDEDGVSRGRCDLRAGHRSIHRDSTRNETWPQGPVGV